MCDIGSKNLSLCKLWSLCVFVSIFLAFILQWKKKWDMSKVPYPLSLTFKKHIPLLLRANSNLRNAVEKIPQNRRDKIVPVSLFLPLTLVFCLTITLKMILHLFLSFFFNSAFASSHSVVYVLVFVLWRTNKHFLTKTCAKLLEVWPQPLGTQGFRFRVFPCSQV